MRYGIFSDVHSNTEALDAVLEAYEKEQIDEYLCLGDLVGYGAEPNECVTRIRALAKATVAGNHDWASVGLFPPRYFNPYALAAVKWTAMSLSEENTQFLRGLDLVSQAQGATLVHGTLQHPEEFDYLSGSGVAAETFMLLKENVCFVGHTHVPGVFVREDDTVRYEAAGRVVLDTKKQYIVNAGSVGQPRDGDPRAVYCVYDSATKEVQLKRAAYDSAAAREKIISAGLPRFLGDRLLKGV